MFTNNTSDENKLLVNSIQEVTSRLSIYAINKCEDQVIGFEFITKQYESNPRCCNSIMVNLCLPVEVIKPIQITKAEFWATDDNCYKDWIVKKKDYPEIELQKDIDENTTGILVRFSKNDTCCYPLNMAFKLYAFDSMDCKFLLSSGLMLFR